MDDEVAQRLGWGERRVDLPAGRYDTILPPSAVADLMIDAYWYAGARDAWEGQSVYSRRGGGTRIGERITAPGVHLYSDPACTRAGVRAVQRRDLVGQRHARSSTTACPWVAPTGSATASSPRCCRPGTRPR